MRRPSGNVLLLLLCGAFVVGCSAPSRMQPAPGVRVASLSGLPPATAQRKIIRNAWLTLEVKNERAVKETLDRVRQFARHSGGYIASERRDAVVLKLPTSQLEEAMVHLVRLGKVARRDINTEDVSSAYLDLEIRIENARRLQARLRELLKQTADVQQILTVEKELGRVTEDLERFEGTLRLMQNQTTFASVDVSVREEILPGPVGWVFKGLYVGVKWLIVWD